MFRAFTLFIQLISLSLVVSSYASANDEIWLFEDPTGTKSYDEVLANPQWFEQTSDTSRGFSDSVFWIRVELNNPLSTSIKQVVQFDSIALPEVVEFWATANGVKLRSNGYLVPFELRPSHYKQNSQIGFPHLLKPLSSETLLYRIETPYKVNLGLVVLDANHESGAAAKILIQAFVIGAIAMLLLYNLMLAMTVRTAVYWSYTAFMLSSLLWATAMFRYYELFGFTADLLWLETRIGVFVYATAGWFLMALFADQQTPTIRHLSKFYFALVFAHLLLEPRICAQSYALISGPIVFGILLVIIGNAIRQGSPLAKFVLVGWVVYVAFSLLFVGNMIGLLDSKFENFFVYGNLVEGFVYSMVLAYRVRLADKTETLLKEAQVELQRERMASEIGYGYKWELDLERQMIRPDATFAAWHGRGWQAGKWYPVAEALLHVPEETRAAVAAERSKAIAEGLLSGQPFTTLHEMVRADTGSRIWIQAHVKHLKLDGRDLLIGTSLDVTKLVQSNQAVESEAEKFESLCEQATLLFWRLDLATKTVTYNRTFAKRWSLEPGGTIEFNEFANFMTPTFVKIMEESVDQVVSTREPVERVVQAMAAPLTGQWYRLQFWPLVNEQGEVIGVDFANANINTLMQTQAELQSTLTKQKELFAIVGHELRTPVSSIKMLTEDEQITDRERTQQIAEISEGLLHVLEDMRVVISPERALESKSVAENPAKLVRRALNSLKAIVAERGLSLSTEGLQRSSATYLLHAQSLRQIVTNLVKNAAIHSGGSRINVGFEISYVAGSAMARLRVEDDGKGIPAEKVEQLFEAFSRGETTQDGSGLGLYIVKQLAERLGGQIRYSQSPLGGACFTLNFALGEEVEAVKEIAQEPTPISLEGMRVLIAEDDNTLRMLTERMLTKKGAIVTACVNGREALDRFDPEQFDLVVTDLMMPEMDGHELTRAIRATGATTHIVAVTAAVIGSETEQFMQEGADAVLSKPLKAETLVETLMQKEIATQSMC